MINTYSICSDKNPTGTTDRMGRMASHLLNQKNFYPLYPPNKEICIDHDLFNEFAIMPCKPHILILPSNLRHFVKVSILFFNVI